MRVFEVVIVAFVWLVACGSDGEVCVPGEQLPCTTCESGLRTCLPSGLDFGPCECATLDAGDGSSSDASLDVRDASSDAAPDADAGSSDVPDADDFVLTSIRVPDIVPGEAVHGFDIDGRESDERDAEGCQVEDLLGIDGRRAVDNQFAADIDLFNALLDRGGLDRSVNTRIQAGIF